MVSALCFFQGKWLGLKHSIYFGILGAASWEKWANICRKENVTNTNGGCWLRKTGDGLHCEVLARMSLLRKVVLLLLLLDEIFESRSLKKESFSLRNTYFMCMDNISLMRIYLQHVCVGCLWTLEEDLGSSGTGVMDSGEQSCGCWESNPHLLQEQQVL